MFIICQNNGLIVSVGLGFFVAVVVLDICYIAKKWKTKHRIKYTYFQMDWEYNLILFLSLSRIYEGLKM